MIKKMADLNKRLLVSTIVVLIVGFLLAFYSYTYVTALLVILIAAIVGVGVWEYANFALAKSLKPTVSCMIFVGVLEVFAFFAAHKQFVFPEFPALILVLGAVLFFLLHFKNTSDALIYVAVEFFGVCYVSVPLSFLLGILYPIMHHDILQDGRWWLIYLILVTKITDVAGYFVGRLWGKHKLAPVLSPKKTVEGALAGFVFAILMSVSFSFIGKMLAPHSFHLPLKGAIFLGMLIGVFAQVGDLAESLLKRDAIVKDSNRLPGLGGILDMMDSLLLTTPIVYFYLRINS